MTHESLFDPSAALAVLDVIADRSKADLMPNVEKAWDAAWIACLTSCARWTDEAEERFAEVLTELGRKIRPEPAVPQ